MPVSPPPSPPRASVSSNLPSTLSPQQLGLPSSLALEFSFVSLISLTYSRAWERAYLHVFIIFHLHTNVKDDNLHTVWLCGSVSWVNCLGGVCQLNMVFWDRSTCMGQLASYYVSWAQTAFLIAAKCFINTWARGEPRDRKVPCMTSLLAWLDNMDCPSLLTCLGER